MADPVQDFLHSFSAYYRNLRLYPSRHPSCQNMAQRYWEALEGLIQLQQHIKIGVLDDTLFINAQLCDVSNPAAEGMLEILRSLEIEGFEIQRFIQKEQAQRFVELLHSDALRGTGFETTLRHHGIDTIQTLDSRETEHGNKQARRVYSRVIRAVAETCSLIENNQIPSGEKLFGAAENITRELTRAPYAFLALTMIKDYDDYTYCHSVNVSVLAIAIARACNLSHHETQILGVGALMHDLGKLRISPEIIKKPGPLSVAEFEEIKRHPELGAEIALQMDDISPEIIDIIRGHHLYYDRSGYPRIQLSSTNYPYADIASVADTYDALTTLRAYRHPNSPGVAIQRLQQIAGTQLNPQYVGALIRILGTYPVGSLVRLVNNEIGLIVDGDIEDMERGTIRILRDSNGNAIDTPRLQELESKSRYIAGEVDPLLHNINISEWL
ncbi:MAG: HD-GYP domain-containing protein [Geobacteraceae bacterium]|nr:HD-GYP domain-containing protein [Geobacteraceae bacterium]